MQIHIKMKETIDFKLDKIEFRLKESIPNQIMISSWILITLVYCILAPFILGMFVLLVIVLSSLFVKGKEKKKFRELFNKHYEVKIKNR